jgi:hypothetical protein
MRVSTIVEYSSVVRCTVVKTIDRKVQVWYVHVPLYCQQRKHLIYLYINIYIFIFLDKVWHVTNRQRFQKN